MKRNKPGSFKTQEDPETGKQKNNEQTGSLDINQRLLQALSIAFFLLSWVANGEMLQAISTGLLGPAYNKPATVTWFSYNYMMLGILIVIPYVKYHRKWTLSFYILNVWSGTLGLKTAFLSCALISLMLQVLNVLLILGLDCISVSLSNAVYQIQAAFTVGLSVCIFKDKFVVSEALGIVVAVLGVAWIVLPPLLLEQDKEQSASATTTCSRSYSTAFGILATLASASIGGTYLVAWRVFDEVRNTTNSSSRLEGLVDTQMTLTVIGICNLLVGWSIPVLAHMLGLEDFHPPTNWWILHCNGLVEYAFDASCAVAIYTTSPVIVAIVSPLTIPLSCVADWLLYNSSGSATVFSSVTTCLGSAVILVGVALMETKPDFTSYQLNWQKA